MMFYLLVGVGDWSPLGFFDSQSITPNGDNFYQYSNHAMDCAIGNYTQSINFENQDYWGKEIQKILYEDLPAISIVYPIDLIPHDINFDTTSWDILLWNEDFQSMENWSIPGQKQFHLILRIFIFTYINQIMMLNG